MHRKETIKHHKMNRMKTMKSFLWIAALFISLPIQSQQPEPVESLGKEIHDADWYRIQSGLWEKETLKNPDNETAWEYYFRATRYLSICTTDKEEAKKAHNSLQEIVGKMELSIPGTFTLYLFRYFYNGWGKEYENDMQKAYEMRPDDVNNFDRYITFLLLTNKIPEMQEVCKKWYDTGEYSPSILNYAYNELAGTEENAIIFSYGDATIYPKLLIQNGKGLFCNRKIVAIPLLWKEEYRRALIESLQLPPFVEEKTYISQDEQEIDIIKHIIDNTKQSVYFSWGMGNHIVKAFEKNLYSEGLTTKYSVTPYDNMAVKQRNYEQVYLLDYLSQSFYKDTYEDVTQRINLSYIYGFQPLMLYYKNKDTDRYKRLYSTLDRIISKINPEEQKAFWEYIGKSE